MNNRHYGMVVESTSAIITNGYRYMLVAPMENDMYGNERWTFMGFGEASPIEHSAWFKPDMAWLTFGPGHAWTEVEDE